MIRRRSAVESWYDTKRQSELWSMFVRYAQTRSELLDLLPDGACVILVPEDDIALEQQHIAELLRIHVLQPGTQVAYVHLGFAPQALTELRPELPAVARVHIEVPLENRVHASA